MKAIYLIRHGESRQAFEIRETEIPKAGKNEVVIKVKASGLNFADVRQKAGQKGVDAVFDNLGGKAFSRGLKLLAPGGKLITYGAASMNKGEKSGMINTLRVAWGFGFRSPVSLIGKSQSIIGVNMLRIADHHPEILKQCMQEVINLAKQKVIRPSLSQTFPANQIAEAHDFLEQRKSRGKVALLWDNN